MGTDDRGIYLWSVEFCPYHGSDQPHCANGLVVVSYEPRTGSLPMEIIVTIAPKGEPSEVKSACHFGGRFETKTPGRIGVGDGLVLNILLRVGVGEAASPAPGTGTYRYAVQSVSRNPDGTLQEMSLALAVDNSKGGIRVRRVSETAQVQRAESNQA